MISPVNSQVSSAADRAITTIQVAHLSAIPTIFAFPASADCTSRIIRWMELSSPTLVARISKEPNWLTVPEETSSPTVLSTGRDSPVITAWLTDVCPERITPSTGTVSPGRTRSRSPTLTCSAGTIFSESPAITLAVCGVRCTSFSIPARALATVRSSRSAPSCMINATSPAAKSSPMQIEAISASDTSTSALMSNAVTRPINASRIMGIPHTRIATQAISKGSGTIPSRLSTSDTPAITRQAISFFVPPSSRNRSNISMNFFIKYLISAHALCAYRVCVKCAQTQISCVKNLSYMDFSHDTSFLSNLLQREICSDDFSSAVGVYALKKITVCIYTLGGMRILLYIGGYGLSNPSPNIF